MSGNTQKHYRLKNLFSWLAEEAECSKKKAQKGCSYKGDSKTLVLFPAYLCSIGLENAETTMTI
jgi:hypothetical protein